jgi:NADH-quinone oxidoreductase subunit A
VLHNYLPIYVYLCVALGIGLVLLGLGFLIGKKLSRLRVRLRAFEDSRMKFDVRYYLVAILFIVFDLEIAFLFPWAITLDSIGRHSARWPWASSSSILVVGFIYEWKKGALEWD